MTSTVVLITGGNRGIGEGLVGRFLAQPHHTVIAAVRNPEHPTSQSLANLTRGTGSTLIMIRYDAGEEASAAAVVDELQSKHGVDHLDTVVANAGISRDWPLVKDVKLAVIEEHVRVNVLGVIALYQATRDLLRKSKNPVFAPMGSSGGSLGNQPPVPSASYAGSKCMLNWYGVRIHGEDEWLTSIILDPGWTKTDMGWRAAEVFGNFGFSEPWVELEDSINGLFKVLTTATREKWGGKFVAYTGEIQAW
ncbi:hypothetical protein B0J18DRAFT_31340 [Chaetomium sp. MPI-SDFR-AT-0129]|nr:hypothetical protein B0J18DRAFT_31340 [Chaetomium sp. MPI-SDFR-AT-0129]